MLSKHSRIFFIECTRPCFFPIFPRDVVAQPTAVGACENVFDCRADLLLCFADIPEAVHGGVTDVDGIRAFGPGGCNGDFRRICHGGGA